MSLEYISEKILDLSTREQLVEIVKEIHKEKGILEKKLVELEDWKNRSTEYEVVNISQTQAILIQNKKNKFYYCPVCFESKRIIPLQPYGSLSKVCPDCKAVYEFENSKHDYSQGQPSW